MKPWEPPGLIKSRMAKYILMSLAVGVAIPIFLSSPYGLYYLIRGAVRAYFRRSDFHREIKRLKKRGYVALTKTQEGWIVRLLKKGQKKVKMIQMQDLKLPPARVWDKKWRLLVFDIPEGNKTQRDLLRKKLKDLGMYNFQRSVFAYPYDCREELAFISEYYNLGQYTTYAEVIDIDIDKELRKYFKIS